MFDRTSNTSIMMFEDSSSAGGGVGLIVDASAAEKAATSGRGPVGVLDLWIRFLRDIPLWLVVFSVTYFTCVSFQHSRPFTQLLICLPIGILAGLVTILILPYERCLIMEVIRTIVELVKRNMLSQPSRNAVAALLR